MRRMPKLSRVMSLGLAIALMVSSPMSAFAENEDASAETQIEITSEGEPASDSNVEASALESNAGASEDVVPTDDASEPSAYIVEAQPEETVSDDSNNNEEINNEEINNEAPESDDAQVADESGKNDESDAQKVADDASDVIDDVENKTSDDADEETKVDEELKEDSEDDADINDADDEDDDEDLDEEDKDDEEDLEDDEEEEIEYSYSSNGDGTHVKSWTDEDGEVHEETEDCSYDENGKCTHCGYEFEIEYTYTSNNDGTHIKSWVDAFGEEHSEEEECEYDENGICKYCKFELEDDDEIIELTDANGIVTIRAKKSVLNGAVKVTADEITVESDEDAYNDMADALEDEVGEESSVVDFVAYDINLYDEEGNVVEPTGELRVIFNDLSVDGIDDDSLTTEIYHYDNESVDKIEQVNVENADAVEMTTDHFSTYIVAVKDSSRVFKSNYINLYSYYYQNYWTNKNRLYSVNSSNSGYYVNASGKKYFYYPLQIRVYLDNATSPVETLSYAQIVGNDFISGDYFKVSTVDGYTVSGFKTGAASSYSMDNMSDVSISDGYYYSSLSNYLDWDYNGQYYCKKTINYIDVYLKSQMGQITISDSDLLSAGTLTATLKLSDALATELANKTVQYRWKKSVGDADYVACENETFENLGDKIVDTTTGSTINIVLDEGALTDKTSKVLYKIEAYYVDDNGIEQQIVESDEYSVTYYNSLQNGSFETPQLSGTFIQCSNDSYKSQGGVWQSTGTASDGNAIEIINADYYNDAQSDSNWNSYNWHNSDGSTTVYAADGTQFAEINCSDEGALYQDVLTVKGRELNYWFSHRARGNLTDSTEEVDTMYVVIMPTSLAKNESLDTQDELSSYLSNINLANMSDNQEYVDSAKGIYILKVSDDDQKWTEYVGTYTPTEYATRFYFVSGETDYDRFIKSLPTYQQRGYKLKTAGNFIDKVGFSQDKPPVEEGKFELSFTKTINGLSNNQSLLDELLGKLCFEIVAVDSEGAVVDDAPLNGTVINANDESVSTETEGSSTILTWTSGKTSIGNNSSYYYIIREKNAELSNSEYSLSAKTRWSYSEDVEQKIFTNESDEQENYLKLSSGSNAEFKFTNSYSVKTTVDYSALIDKSAYVTDFDARTYNVELDTLDYTVDRQNGLEPVDVILLIDVSGSMNFPSDLEKVTINSTADMDTTTTYYYIEQTAEAKINRISYHNDKWYVKDAAYDDDYKDQFTFASRQYYVQKQGGHDRKYYLTNAAKKLIDSLPDGSNVSLVTFAKDASVKTFSGSNVICLNSTDNRTSVKDAIDDAYKTVNGGTNQTKALGEAKTLLSNETYKASTNSKAVVLVSDGCPNGTTSSAAISKASEVKALTINGENPEIYSIGIDLDVNDAMSSAKELLKGCATSNSYYYNSKAEYLDVIFQMIAAKLTKAEIYATKGDVVDVVDVRFDVYDDSGNKITQNGSYTLGGKTANVVLNGDGTTKITWSNQELGKIDTTNNTVSKWHATFKIVAKADFLGGNEVATNGSSSGVYIGDKVNKFPQPSVNVKELELAIGNGVETKFIGEQLEVHDYATALDYLKKTIEGIDTEAAVAVGFDSQTGNYVGTAQYAYPGTKDPVGDIKYTLSRSTTEEFCDENGVATKCGIPVQVYTLKVEYVPYEVSKRTEMETTNGLNTPVESDGATPQQTTTGNLEKTGTYTINVITAELLITKYGLGYGDNPSKDLLGGAVFNYFLNADTVLDTQTSSSESANKGILSFGQIKYGISYVQETTAPEGYTKSNSLYTISVAHAKDVEGKETEDYVITITSDDSKVTEETVDVSVFLSSKPTTTVAKQLSFEVINHAVYVLPKTGGIGVYGYTIGGVLLMMGAMLLLYKNKKQNKKNNF